MPFISAPRGNLQGTFKAFDLKTGGVKKNRNFTRVTMPDSVVKLVNDQGKRSQKEHQNNKLEFLNRLQQKIDWDNSKYDEGEDIRCPLSWPHGEFTGTFKAFDLKTGCVKKNRNFTRVQAQWYFG